MPLTQISISGYRGFSRKQSMEFAVPNGEYGSGLTLITGSNNSGKSTILEALRARVGKRPVSFTSGTRNISQQRVEISYIVDGKEEILRTRQNSSEVESYVRDEKFEIYVLPSRRTFDPYFGKGFSERRSYINNNTLPAQRSSSLGDFSGRLFKIMGEPSEFNSILKRVLDFEPRWTIDQGDQGGYYLKFAQGRHTHSSDGMGEGIVSLFAIVDALYDSNPGSMIVIDEPELSLHPSLQKRACELLLEYAGDRQVVISTHSPYFVALDAVARGGIWSAWSVKICAARPFISCPTLLGREWGKSYRLT